jgi:hypothetical protein
MGSVTADHGASTNWGNDDPSVFVVNNIYGLQGEYQICNGYSAGNATEVLRVRCDTVVSILFLLRH